MAPALEWPGMARGVLPMPPRPVSVPDAPAGTRPLPAGCFACAGPAPAPARPAAGGGPSLPARPRPRHHGRAAAALRHAPVAAVRADAGEFAPPGGDHQAQHCRGDEGEQQGGIGEPGQERGDHAATSGARCVRGTEFRAVQRHLPSRPGSQAVDPRPQRAHRMPPARASLVVEAPVHQPRKRGQTAATVPSCST